jgi:hypothetical protein
LAGAFWHLAADPEANAHLGTRLIYASGACSFVTCLLGWYLFMSIMMASLDFPVELPGKFEIFSFVLPLVMITTSGFVGSRSGYAWASWRWTFC